MSASTTQPAKSKPRKPREKDKDKERPLLPSERLKLAVRRLPSTLPEEIFWQSVSSWVTDETVTWKAYFPGKPKKRANKENIPSRAYIAFKDPEQSLIFGREYDGHKFVDKAGNETYVTVEFAPYQKIPSEKKKPDARNATIEKDEDYISFLESLNAPPNTEPISIEALIASTRPPSPPKTTPLLEALKAERQAQKDKEAIIRNHPHYKDTMNATAILRKGGERKAAAQAEAAASLGKKPKKGAPPIKQIHIQAKPPASGNANTSAKPTAVLPPKLQTLSAKSGRGPKHHAKSSATPVVAPPASATAATATPATDAPPSAANNAANIPTAQDFPSAAPARRERPVLGLGSRHFEAALNGAGVTPIRERRRREKGNDAAPPVASGSTASGRTQNAPAGEKPLPVSPPKRPPRQRKDGPASSRPNGDAVTSGELMATSGASAVETGAVSHPGGGHGGRRGRGGGGGRGRGGPPRVG